MVDSVMVRPSLVTRIGDLPSGCILVSSGGERPWSAPVVWRA